MSNFERAKKLARYTLHDVAVDRPGVFEFFDEDELSDTDATEISQYVSMIALAMEGLGEPSDD